jgi:rubrerythrin
MQNLDAKGPPLDALSLKECLLLTLRVERRCAQQLELLASRVVDPELRGRLLRMAADEREHLQLLERLDETTPWPPLLQVNDRQLHWLGTEHVSALGTTFDDSVDEDHALDFVRRVEEQSAHLYQQLAQRTEDQHARSVFLRIADAEQLHLAHFLRET